MAQRNAKLKPRHIMTREQIDSMMDVKSVIPRTPSMVGIGGFQITNHITYRYMTGIAPLVKCKYFGNFDGHHPRYINNPCDVDNLGTKNTGCSSTDSVNFERIYDYGVASVVTIPLYTVDPVSEIPGRLITGEITGMPIVRKITPRPTARQSFPEHENVGTDYTRNDFNTTVDDSIDDGLFRFDESYQPDDESLDDPTAQPWLIGDDNDGDYVTGCVRDKMHIPSSRIIDTDFIPSQIIKKWDKLPGAVQRFWVGVVYLKSRNGMRNDADTAVVVGKMFHVSEKTVRRCGIYASERLEHPGSKLAGNFTVPDITVSETPIDGDWDLVWNTTPRKPWETMDGNRSYSQWGFDGPTDMADAKRRAALNSA